MEYHEKHLYDTREKLDKFGYGEWIEEPDHVTFEHLGYDCEICRSRTGVLCGYIVLPEGHPWIDQDYREIATNVHGGLTFAQHRRNGYTVGFECCHYKDKVPGLQKVKIAELLELNIVKSHGVYRNLDYCITQCKLLVEEAIKA
jgi:hypothetical protein